MLSPCQGGHTVLEEGSAGHSAGVAVEEFGNTPVDWELVETPEEVRGVGCLDSTTA